MQSETNIVWNGKATRLCFLRIIINKERVSGAFSVRGLTIFVSVKHLDNLPLFSSAKTQFQPTSYM